MFSLLDLLAGRKELSACIGKVLVDEKKQPRNFKCMSGYVIQVCNWFHNLTLRSKMNLCGQLFHDDYCIENVGLLGKSQHISLSS